MVFTDSDDWQTGRLPPFGSMTNFSNPNGRDRSCRRDETQPAELGDRSCSWHKFAVSCEPATSRSRVDEEEESTAVELLVAK